MDTLGEIRAFGGNYAPRNYVLCDGSLLQISQYQALYTLLGTLYGGNGVTTFGVPDLRGRALVNGYGATGFAVGQAGAGGAESVTLATAEIPAHTHTVNVSTAAATTNVASSSYFAAGTDNGSGKTVLSYLTNNPADTTQELVPLNQAAITNNNGLGGNILPHENRQPFMGITYIMCVVGLFPQLNN